jgi:propanediol utilization protein
MLLQKKLAAKITEELIAYIRAKPIPVAISNRHIHLSKEAKNTLFGPEPLTVKKNLGQPGEFAAEETVKLIGPRSHFEEVRVVGPEREKTQVELSISDCYHLGISPVVRISGNHEETPGIYVIGPKGFIELESGVIVAQRHIHMPSKEAYNFNVRDMQSVRIRFNSGPREGILGGVLVRVSERAALECHLDVEEANALGIKNGDHVFMEIGGI